MSATTSQTSQNRLWKQHEHNNNKIIYGTLYLVIGWSTYKNMDTLTLSHTHHNYMH